MSHCSNSGKGTPLSLSGNLEVDDERVKVTMLMEERMVRSQGVVLVRLRNLR